MSVQKDLVCVGQIQSPHGLKGALRVVSHTQNPSDLLAFGSFLDVKGAPFVVLDKLLFQEKTGTFVVTFKEVTTRTAAEALQRHDLFISADQLPPLEADSFYHRDLVGLCVQDETGEAWGRIRAVDNFGASDVVEVVPKDSEIPPFWLPFLMRYVPEVNVKEGWVRINVEDWRASGMLSDTPDPSNTSDETR
jgi:16S rRNA processing protein RimM